MEFKKQNSSCQPGDKLHGKIKPSQNFGTSSGSPTKRAMINPATQRSNPTQGSNIHKAVCLLCNAQIGFIAGKKKRREGKNSFEAHDLKKIIECLCLKMELPFNELPKEFSKELFPFCRHCIGQLKDLQTLHSWTQRAIHKMLNLSQWIERTVVDTRILLMNTEDNPEDARCTLLRDMILEGYKSKLIANKKLREKIQRTNHPLKQNDTVSQITINDTHHIANNRKRNRIEIISIEDDDRGSSSNDKWSGSNVNHVRPRKHVDQGCARDETDIILITLPVPSTSRCTTDNATTSEAVNQSDILVVSDEPLSGSSRLLHNNSEGESPPEVKLEVVIDDDEDDIVSLNGKAEGNEEEVVCAEYHGNTPKTTFTAYSGPMPTLKQENHNQMELEKTLMETKLTDLTCDNITPNLNRIQITSNDSVSSSSRVKKATKTRLPQNKSGEASPSTGWYVPLCWKKSRALSSLRSPKIYPSVNSASILRNGDSVTCKKNKDVTRQKKLRQPRILKTTKPTLLYEKDKSCPMCNKSFERRCNYAMHLKMHKKCFPMAFKKEIVEEDAPTTNSASIEIIPTSGAYYNGAATTAKTPPPPRCRTRQEIAKRIKETNRKKMEARITPTGEPTLLEICDALGITPKVGITR